jgi:small multidrug resistance family-3 protein
MILLRAAFLFILTDCAEILGCYLPYLWLRENKSVWLLLPAAGSLATFAWLLSLHPGTAARRLMPLMAASTSPSPSPGCG